MTAPPIMTASGQPEITLRGVDPQCVHSAFLELFVNQGFAIRSTSDAQIIAGKERNDFAGFLASSRFAGFPEDRITALFIRLPDNGMRVILSEQIVTNAGTGFEMPTPITQSQAVQDQFASVTEGAEARCAIR